jgi:ATP-dependent protease ClpP protease subunit
MGNYTQLPCNIPMRLCRILTMHIKALDTERDYYMSAGEALDYGVIDKIVSHV